MVLEQLYSAELLERKSFYAFILGIGYAVIGIGVSVLLFPEDPAIVAVAFTAILILPSLRALLRDAENIEAKEERTSLVGFFRDHKSVFFIYALLFLGIFLVFSFFSLVLPNLATNHIFENQLGVLYGNTGRAIGFDMNMFVGFIENNAIVLLLCMLTALFLGDGGIFLITWNASVWGTIFGNIAKCGAFAVGKNPYIYFALILITVFPHMMLEAFSYFSSAASGGIISRALMKEHFFSERFNQILKKALYLLAFALLVLVVAALVETYVLNNFETYRIIVQQCFGWG